MANHYLPGKYKGKLTERLAHSISDTAIEQVKDYAKEKNTNDMLDPVIDAAAKHIDIKAHQVVNNALGDTSEQPKAE